MGRRVMTAGGTSLRRDISQIIAWSIFLPALAFWPFLSAFPAFALLDGAGSNLAAAIQGMLFVTGFWAVAGMALVLWLLLSDAAKARYFANRSEKSLLIGGYAALWTALYIIAAFAGR